jgi:hypothetical protein
MAMMLAIWRLCSLFAAALFELGVEEGDDLLTGGYLEISVPALTSVAGLMLAYADAKNGSALVIARNHPWKSPK